jgi:regulator of sirC expression with transglutaminase-like and TPR domain
LLEQLFQVQESLEEVYIKNQEDTSKMAKQHDEMKHLMAEAEKKHQDSLKERDQKIDILVKELSIERGKDGAVEKYKKELEMMRNSLNVLKEAYNVSLTEITNKFKNFN